MSTVPTDGIQIVGGWVEMIHSPTYRWICECGEIGPIRAVPQEAADGLDSHRRTECLRTAPSAREEG